MNRRISLALVLLGALVALAAPATAAAKPAFRPKIGKAMGLMPAIGQQANAGDGIPTVYHGGQTMTTGTVTLHTIFWAPSGYSFGGPPSPGAPAYEPLVQQFLVDSAHDSGSSNAYSVLSQFGDNSGAGRYSIAYDPATDSIDDTHPYPAASDQCSSPNGTQTCITDAQLTSEVDRIIQTTDPSGRGLQDLWEVFLPANVDECILPDVCGTNAFGGYHSLANTGNGTFYYAVIINTLIEAPPVQGNDPQGNPVAENAINIAAHETVEAMTDPSGVGWMDPNGYEVADKCEFGPQIGTPLGYAPNGSPYNQVINGHDYLIQDMWSNNPSGCVQSAATTTDGLPLASVSLSQYSPHVSGNVGTAKAGVGVLVGLLRAGKLVAQAQTTTDANGGWALSLAGRGGMVHATGDDRDIVTVQYGPGGPAPDLIATGSGGNPFNEAGWTGWLDLDTGVRITPQALTIGPCFQAGVLTATVNGTPTAPLTPECGTASDAATVPTPTLTSASQVLVTSNDNRAPSPDNPLGALVSLTVPVGEPDSVSAIGNDNVLFNPSGFPVCTAQLRLQEAVCSGLVRGERYTLASSRGHAMRHAKANGHGSARFTGLRLTGGDVLSLVNSSGRTLTRLHVAHLRVAIDGNETILAGGSCQPGDYWGAPLQTQPVSPAVGEGGVTGQGKICPSSGRAKGLPDGTIEQIDDLSGGTTTTSVPLLTGTAPANDAIVYGAFRAIAQTGVPAAHGKVASTGAAVALTITRRGARRAVFHAGNVSGRGALVRSLRAGVYTATWIVRDTNGDTRTVHTRFVVA